MIRHHSYQADLLRRFLAQRVFGMASLASAVFELVRLIASPFVPLWPEGLAIFLGKASLRRLPSTDSLVLVRVSRR